MAVYSKCIPLTYKQSIFDINYQHLKEQGIKTLFFDLDNTIIGYDETEISQSHIRFFKALSKSFQIVIISNSGKKRVAPALAKSDLKYVWHAKKPLKFGFNQALKMVAGEKSKTILIGDQLMTDVLGGNRFGISVILVRSVKRKSDRWITQFNRKLEKRVIRKIKAKLPALYDERLKAYVDDHAV
jgi:uncharacterized protein